MSLNTRLSQAHYDRLQVLREKDPDKYAVRRLLERLIDAMWAREFASAGAEPAQKE